VKHPSGPRNLVVVRAGDRSLHGAWLDGARAGHYDLIVSYFGADPDRYRSAEENRVDYRGGKWDGIHAVFAADPTLLDRYDYFWLPDDDIDADSAAVATLFRCMKQYDLALAQPALTHDSYFSYLIFLQCPSFEVRYANAIEVMVPCLRRDILAIVLPLFRDTKSGFGLDFVWTRLLPDNKWKSAILDCVTVRHTRPVGGELHKSMAKTGGSARAEQRTMLKRLGLRRPKMMAYAGKARDGRILQSPWQMARAMGLDYLAVRHRAVQSKWITHLFRIISRHLRHRRTDLTQVVPAPERNV
jgi:hypothetical protein